ncbi:hypothetical protein AYO49_04845 [Verrucomicrobiaceae bacterium SCGC AG-212-N21]|nr:hypothetical protein AYO49_04845 [Verrucomicrobiaceae bacterium SCGC AG-212-N21]
MSEREGGHEKLLAAIWVLLLIGIVFLVYLLSVRPLQWKLGHDPFGPPTLFSRYCEPYLWLRNHTSLGAPLTTYEDWWVRRQMKDALLPPPDAFGK